MYKSTIEDDLPTGFERVWLDSSNSMLLPVAAADARREEQRRRAEAEAERRQDDQRRQRAELQADLMAQASKERGEKTEQELAGRKRYGPNPESGWHRVLPRLAELEKELDAPQTVGRSADKDVNERRRKICEKLLELGPDRRITLPAQWRAAVDDLEQALPHFRRPIRALRNALALAEETGTAPRIAPQLLLGPPGVGKTYFSHRVAQLFGSVHASVHFDQPSAGAQLRGSDKYWSNSEPGLLFNLICLGEYANPVILLDEMDKCCGGSGSREIDPLAQLHSVLERETAQRLVDVSVDLAFDASLAIYIGTANSLRGIGAPILSRMEVFIIEPPNKWEAVDIATSIAHGVLRRLGLEGRVMFERKALYLMSNLSPRQMTRIAEQSIAAAVTSGRKRIDEDELWNEIGGGSDMRLH